MNHSLPSQRSCCFLFLSVGLITSLILLINVSFKIVLIEGLMFSVTCLICPLIAGLYLSVLRNCTIKEQRHLLNISLLTLYVFCIGVYILINLPAAEYMHNNPVYQIIFEDIPKKFFATTIAFALSFYLPHLMFYPKTKRCCLPRSNVCSLQYWVEFVFLLLIFFYYFQERIFQVTNIFSLILL